MEEKRIPVSFRVSSRFKRCLALAAAEDQRSQTNFIEKLVFDYCREACIDPDTPEAAKTSVAPPESKKKGTV